MELLILSMKSSAGMFSTVAQLVEALRYKPEGRGFEFRWGHWDFSLRSSCTMARGSSQLLTEIIARGFSLAGKGGRCVGLTTLPPSCAVDLKILGASTSWIPKDLYKLYNCRQRTGRLLVLN